MIWTAIRRYEIHESSTDGLFYRIEIRRAGSDRILDLIVQPTQKQALDELDRRGYVREPK